jgi:hypothetical protein
LRCLFPRLLQETNRNAAPLAGLTLDLCQQGGFVAEVEFMLYTGRRFWNSVSM